MLLRSKKKLKTDLVEILETSEHAMNLDEIIQQLFFKRRQFMVIMVITQASLNRQIRLKRKIERLLDQGVAVRTLEEEEVRFTRKIPESNERMRD